MPKKIPLRMCVACRNMLPKSELLRIVRSDGGLSFDVTGKKSGRGAYVCKNPECIAKCAKKHFLDKAFGEKIPDEVYERLKNECAELIENK